MRSVLIWVMAASGAIAQPSEWAKLVSQGDRLTTDGHYREAAAAYESALRLAASFEPADYRIPATLNKLAMSYHDLGRFSDAIPLYRRAIASVERSPGKNTEQYTALLNNLAAVYLEQGQLSKAEHLIREVMAIDETILSPDDPRLAKASSILADVLIGHGEYREGERLLTQAVHVFEIRPETKRELGIALNNLGVVRRSQKQFGEARHAFEAARAAIESDAGPDHPLLARVLNNLGSAYADLDLRDMADTAYRQSIQLAEASSAVEHPVYAIMLRNYAKFLRDTGRKAEAKSLEARSRSVIQDSARRNGVGMTVDVSAFRQK